MKKHLDVARKVKCDEFYTRYEDVKAELDHYLDKFRDKTVLCNCNDHGSAFERYFRENDTQIKELIITDGRFQDNIGALKRCDIVVTNPPFSQFREFVDLLLKYEKDFIIWGNNNALSYKNVFPLIKAEKVFLCHLRNKTCPFNVPKEYYESGECKVPACSVFTTFDVVEMPKLKLNACYDPKIYPKYDNYDAIEVSSVKDIPCNYDGVMGVPITFLVRWNREQFEVLELAKNSNPYRTKIYPTQIQHSKNGSISRVFKLNDSASIKIPQPLFGKTYYEIDKTYYRLTYARVLIRKIK